MLPTSSAGRVLSCADVSSKDFFNSGQTKADNHLIENYHTCPTPPPSPTSAHPQPTLLSLLAVLLCALQLCTQHFHLLLQFLHTGFRGVPQARQSLLQGVVLPSQPTLLLCHCTQPALQRAALSLALMETVLQSFHLTLHFCLQWEQEGWTE